MDLNWIGWQGVGCIHLAEDRDKLHDVVTTVMNFGFYKMWEISWPNEEVLSSKEGISLRSLLFWDVMHHWLVVSYQCFGTTSWFWLQWSSTALPLKMELIGCPKMSATNYQSTCLSSWKGEDFIYIAAEVWISRSVSAPWSFIWMWNCDPCSKWKAMHWACSRTKWWAR
jgi:hypothetical protein